VRETHQVFTLDEDGAFHAPYKTSGGVHQSAKAWEGDDSALIHPPKIARNRSNEMESLGQMISLV
jgi:hypothetical protein